MNQQVEALWAAIRGNNLIAAAQLLKDDKTHDADRIRVAKTLGIRLFRLGQHSDASLCGYYWRDGDIEGGPFTSPEDAYLDAYFARSLGLSTEEG